MPKIYGSNDSVRVRNHEIEMEPKSSLLEPWAGPGSKILEPKPPEPQKIIGKQ